MNLFTRIFKSLSNLAHYLGGLLLAANGLVYLNRSISNQKLTVPGPLGQSLKKLPQDIHFNAASLEKIIIICENIYNRENN